MNLGAEDQLLKNELQKLQIKLSNLKASHLRELSQLQTRMDDEVKFQSQRHENAIAKLRDTHRHEMNCQEVKISKLNSEMQRLQDCLMKQSRENFELNQKLSVEVEYKGGLHEKERKRLEEQVERAETLLRKKEAELTEVRSNLERVEDVMRGKGDDAKAAQSLVQQSENENKRLQAKLRELESKIVKLEENATELEYTQTRLRVLEVENERLLQETQDPRRSRIGWAHGMGSVGASGASFMHQDQERLREENEELRTVVRKLTEDMQSIRNLAVSQDKAEVARLKEKVGLMEAERAGHEKAVGEFNGEIARLTDENKKLRNQIARLEAERERLCEISAELRAELSSYHEKMGGVEDGLKYKYIQQSTKPEPEPVSKAPPLSILSANLHSRPKPSPSPPRPEPPKEEFVHTKASARETASQRKVLARMNRKARPPVRNYNIKD
mmetsp:Transcript_28809/g.51285  ORF Transcript_28809/g.51285 Transcript_28809/m.51285 type:complete len:443 (-) Transcript_28809:2327-3655(-)